MNRNITSALMLRKLFYFYIIFALSIVACGSGTIWSEREVKNSAGYTIKYFQFIDGDARYTYREIDGNGSFCMIEKDFVYSIISYNDEYLIEKQENITGNIDDDLIPAGDTVGEGLSVLLELENKNIKNKISQNKSVISTKVLRLLKEAGL